MHNQLRGSLQTVLIILIIDNDLSRLFYKVADFSSHDATDSLNLPWFEDSLARQNLRNEER